jgi:hypothetical protein
MHPPVPIQYLGPRRRTVSRGLFGGESGYSEGVDFSERSWDVQMTYRRRSWKRAVSGGGTCNENAVFKVSFAGEKCVQ